MTRTALTSAEVRAWALSDVPRLQEDWKRYAEELAMEGSEKHVDVLREVRLATVRATIRAGDEYRELSSSAHAALDAAYQGMAYTPIVAIGASALLWGLRRFF